MLFIGLRPCAKTDVLYKLKKCFSPPLNDSFVWSFLSFSENENFNYCFNQNQHFSLI